MKNANKETLFLNAKYGKRHMKEKKIIAYS